MQPFTPFPTQSLVGSAEHDDACNAIKSIAEIHDTQLLVQVGFICYPYAYTQKVH